MKHVNRIACLTLLAFISTSLYGEEKKTSQDAAAYRSLQVELPNQEHNAIKTSWPAVGCWFPLAADFQPDGYKRPLDLYAKHSAFKLLTTSIRCPLWVTDPKVHDQMKAAAEYARSLGMGIVLDLESCFARPAFAKKYPDELQGIVRLGETPLKASGEVELSRKPNNVDYFFYAEGFHAVAGKVLRVYSYRAGGQGRGPESVEDITARVRVLQADANEVKIAIPCTAQDEGRTACLLALFTMSQPDIFAPHLPAFEREILEQYKDVPLAGACKDEWGFIPSERFDLPNDLWYSEFLARSYAARRGGRDLALDLLLMSKGEKGRQSDRAAAVNHYMELFWQRNAEIENEFYRSTKAVFGQEAMVGTHPTWWPYPNRKEIIRNGLDWWAVKRDLAQTDESTPFCVRTALAKKWHSPLWYNMYYEASVKPYEEDLWRHALGGGRMNFHPLFPSAPSQWGPSIPLAGGRLMRADCRVRLLNYISTAPIDCPVAVVFSHPRVNNWTGPGCGDAGVKVCDALWKDGYYADLIPSSEIASGALKVSEDGHVQYGPQKYAAVVFYEPQYERPAAGEFFRKAAATGKTALYRIGDWTMDFDGSAVDVQTALPKEMKAADAAACVRDILAQLKASGIEPQTPCTMRGGFVGSMMPKPSGQCRLLDGTIILASGEKDAAGDPIQMTIKVDGHDVAFDAVGVAAVRLDKDGKLEALAAGGLKRFAVGKTKIELPQRIDVALWKDPKGVWQGVLQDYEGEVPKDLAALCKHWTRLQVPEPLKE
jgi:hypothetical protein